MNKFMNVALIAILLIIIGFFMNKLIQNRYDTDIVGYMQKSAPITESELSWLKENKIVFGADENSPPLRYVDKETSQYKGVSIDVVQALSFELGHEIIVEPFAFKDALYRLEEGSIDFCDMFPSTERGKKFLFTDSIYNLRGVILVTSDNTTINSYTDLAGLTVLTPDGDYAIEFLESKNLNIKFKKTQNIEECVRLFLEGKADAVVGDEPVVSYYVDRMDFHGKSKILDAPAYGIGVVFGVSKNVPQLQSILNKAIFKIKQKTVIEKIQQKWFGISVPITLGVSFDSIAVYAIVIIIFAYMVLYYMYYWNRKLDMEVRSRTEDLEMSKNDLQITFDGLTYLMVVIDTDGRVINANKAFYEFCGVSEKNVLGKGCSAYKELLYPCEELESVIAHIRQGPVYKFDSKMGGKIFNTDVFPIRNSKAQVIKALFVIKDVTDLKIAQEKLLQDEKMVVVGQMAMGVAHEIRNPLGLIKSYSYILKSEADAENLQLKKYLDVIESSSDRAFGIVNNLLNFSRISDMATVKTDIKSFTRDLIKLESSMIKKGNITLSEVYEGESYCTVNQESVKHILINLINNAVLAMPQGGELKILCGVENGVLKYEVSDTGVGIKEEDSEKLFYPFFTTREPGQGTGLGLYIVYNEVQKCGGKINFKSEVGCGSVFTVTLPVKAYDEVNEDDKV